MENIAQKLTDIAGLFADLTSFDAQNGRRIIASVIRTVVDPASPHHTVRVAQRYLFEQKRMLTDENVKAACDLVNDALEEHLRIHRECVQVWWCHVLNNGHNCHEHES